MLNKHKRWFHSSRVEFPLVSMSASWFLVSMYLIWILGSKLIRSNNQSRATLWVLETCLIVGLLPFVIILITASLFSNTYNKASWWEDLTFEGKSSLSKSLITPFFDLCEVLNELHVCSQTGLSFLHDSNACFQELRRSDPINQVRRYHPTSILHPKKWFLILLNCAKLKFVSYTSTDWNRCRFWILKISCKIVVLKQSQSALFGSVSHMTILFVFTCMMNVRDQTTWSFVTSLGPFCDRSCKFIHWP